MAAGDRQHQVQEVIEQLRQLEQEPPEAGNYDHEAEVQPRSLAEVLAVLAAEMRAAGRDEAVWVEAALHRTNCSRETLVNTRWG
jgi:hypothetical protein